jgi:hypothetical protein
MAMTTGALVVNFLTPLSLFLFFFHDFTVHNKHGAKAGADQELNEYNIENGKRQTDHVRFKVIPDRLQSDEGNVSDYDDEINTPANVQLLPVFGHFTKHLAFSVGRSSTQSVRDRNPGKCAGLSADPRCRMVK